MPTNRREGAVSVWAIHVRFVVDKPKIGYIFLRVLRCSPVNIIPPKLHPHSSASKYYYYQTENPTNLGIYTKEMLFRISEVHAQCSKYTFSAFREALDLLCTANIIYLSNCSHCKSYIHMAKSYDEG